MTTFSIVLPVYNTEQYLPACLDSIASQSYADFEVIMVDDDSTDGSAAICKEYAERDPRFVYCHKENGGVSSARNVGIGMAKGEWLLFVDSDDVLMPDSLAVFVKMCASPNVDLAMGTYILDSYKQKECFSESKTFDMSLDRNAIMELMFLTHTYNYQGYVWNKVFRTSIVKENNIQFDVDVYYNEDRLFCVQYICKMNGQARFCSLPVYRYNKRQSGAVGGLLSEGYNPNLMTDYESSVTILQLLISNDFPNTIVRLGRDRLVDSYDMIRHVMRGGQDGYAEEIKALRKRTIATVGYGFYIGCCIRRFLSKQYYYVFKKRVYLRG